jgi:hypothetical protein
MMDAAVLAASAVGVLAPYLVEGGKEAAKTMGKEAAAAGLQLLGWLRERLTGAGGEALGDVEKEPADADAQAALRVQVKKLLEREPALAAELERLVSEAEKERPAGVTQSNVQAGDQNRAANVSGSGNAVNVS